MTSLDIIIRIAHRLDELDKSEWFIPVLKWLSVYEGLSFFTESEPSPEEQVLIRLCEIKPTQSNESIIATLVHSLGFLRWRVQFSDGQRWDPTQQALNLFLQQHPEQSPFAWKWGNTYPVEESIAQSLLGLIQAHKTHE